jgi:MYXO-CTERM domain-containing protein
VAGGLGHGDIHNNYYVNPNPRVKGGVAPTSDSTSGLISSGDSFTSTFSLEDLNASDPNPNPNGEVIDSDNEDDMSDPPNLTIAYDGLDTSAVGAVSVAINGDVIGDLDPTNSSVTLDIPLTDLEDGDSVLITNDSDETVNIDSETFDAGALPPEDDSSEVPEPAAAAIAFMGLGLLARRRQRASV